MRILEVNKFFYMRRGAERHFLDLIALLEKNAHEIAVFSMQHPENLASKWERYFVSHVGYNDDDSMIWERIVGIGRLFWSFEARRNMRSLLTDFRPEVVHVHNAYHQLSLSFFPLIKRASIPLVMTVHDYALISPDKDAYYPEVGRQYWKFLRMNKYGFGKRFFLVLKKYWEDIVGFYDCIDRFIVPSRYVEGILLSAGIAKERIVVLPHFVSDEMIDSVVMTDVEVPEKYLLSFGVLSSEKGTETLLSLSSEMKIPILFAGRMEGVFDFTKYPLAKYIGTRTKGELQTLIRKSMAVVSASTLPETFGLTALETIALGKPFLGLNRGALSEIIENGENGFLAKNQEMLADVIRKFLAGEIIFSDDDAIRRQAEERFGSSVYLAQFKVLVEALTTKIIDKK
ncbi:MAG: glycosyltransferase family 4 protein [Candidatus Moraniibacteriota bacterium]